MRPGALYPSQTLNEELIVIGQEGSATIEFDGKTAELTKDQVLDLPPGSVRSLKAGAAGWKRSRSIRRCGWITFGSPDRTRPRRTSPSPTRGYALAAARRRRQPNEIQWTPLTDPVSGEALPPKHGAVAADLGQERANQSGPDGSRSDDSPAHSSEDQLTHTVRGTVGTGRDG